MRIGLQVAAAAAVAALAGRAAAAETSIACDGGIVAIGDAKITLLGKCGAPAVEDVREVERTRVELAPDARTAIVRPSRKVVEEWSYNFGPRRFVMHVRLAEGKVVAIERGSYGYAPEQLAPAQPGARPRCDASALRVGDAKIDLLGKCGEPALRERAGERAPTLVTTLHRYPLASVEVEIWTYDFGPQRFVQLVTLENGRVVAVENGGYGYAR